MAPSCQHFLPLGETVEGWPEGWPESSPKSWPEGSPKGWPLLSMRSSRASAMAVSSSVNGTQNENFSAIDTSLGPYPSAYDVLLKKYACVQGTGEIEGA